MKKLNQNPEKPQKLKRFLAFHGSAYYPRGGWADFFEDFETLDEAKKKLLAKELEKRPPELGYETPWVHSWAQIFDTKTQKIVWTEADS